MVFSSLTFLCIFLPLVLILYFSVPARIRNTVLFAVSLLFYAWGEPVYVFIMLFSTVFDYMNGRLLERFDSSERARKLILVLSVTVNLGILGFFKYADFAVCSINELLSADFGLLKLALPIGISFYTFQTMSYTIDVYRRTVRAQHNIIDFGMFVCMFPQLIAGPVVRYSDIESRIKVRPVNADQIWSGVLRFSIGLGKKVLIANQAGLLYTELSASGALPAADAWLCAGAFAIQIYFDFSGYSDMAIGLGRIFGFEFPENFRYPYESKSITDFWRRWHITLGTWFREYVYIPLGGNRCGTARHIFNMFAVWGLTGLWHGAGWNFVLWGLYYFAVLAAEKYLLKKHMEKWPGWASHVYSLIIILIGWTIFASTDLSTLSSALSGMFGANGAAGEMLPYYLRTYGIFLAVAAVGSTCIVKRFSCGVMNRLSGNETACIILKSVFVVSVVFLCIVFLIGDSYNPFLYFRF